MKKNKILLFGLLACLLTSCYESYENDYETSVAYFASQKPLRTLIADTEMSIKVGVAIGGKREVNKNDWATFDIDPSLLDGTSFTLLPDAYYQLADPGRMTISNTNLAIADVGITFSDELYNDLNALGNYYALPFRMTGHNQDEVGVDVNGEEKDYSIVAIKFVSWYHGTYFIRGKITNLTTNEETQYYNNDLSKNLTRDFVSLGRNKIQRPGFGNTNESGQSIEITIDSQLNVSIEAGGNVAITEAKASVDLNGKSLDSSGAQPIFTLDYKFVKDGDTFHVQEELIRRQSPEADLRFEEW